MKISKRLRFEILMREQFTCQYCGARAPLVPLHVDHVVASSIGGSSDPSNLVTSCLECNLGKGDLSLTDGALRSLRDNMSESACAFDDMVSSSLECFTSFIWCSWSDEGPGDILPLPVNWRAQIERLMRLGMTEDMLVDTAHEAANYAGARPDDKFHYFCQRVLRRL